MHLSRECDRDTVYSFHFSSLSNVLLSRFLRLKVPTQAGRFVALSLSLSLSPSLPKALCELNVCAYVDFRCVAYSLVGAPNRKSLRQSASKSTERERGRESVEICRGRAITARGQDLIQEREGEKARFNCLCVCLAMVQTAVCTVSRTDPNVVSDRLCTVGNYESKS